MKTLLAMAGPPWVRILPQHRPDSACALSLEAGTDTREVFSRYHITEKSDVRDALIKTMQYGKIEVREARKRLGMIEA
jgi:hypothetical protein